MNIDQTINGFNNYISSQGGLPHLNRFSVFVPIPKTLGQNNWTRKVAEGFKFTARTANIPTKTLSTSEVMAGGPEQKYPYQDVYDDLTITFLTTKGSNNMGIPERSFFEGWVDTIVDQKNMLVGFSDEYSVNLSVSVLSNERSDKTKVAEYTFDRAYPIPISAMEFGHDSEELMTFEVTFSYDRWYRITETDASFDQVNATPQPMKPKLLKMEDGERKPSSVTQSKKKVESRTQQRKRKDGWDNFKKLNEVDWTQSPITNTPAESKRKPASEPPLKKILSTTGKLAKKKATNLVKAKLGIRPMLDD